MLVRGVEMANDLGTTARVDVLGPLRLVVDGAPVEVRGPKRRALLALLALADGHAVTADHLVDALWPQAPPKSGRAALHTHISRLRGQLGAAAGRLIRLEGAYRLVLAADETDVGLARALLASGGASAGRDPAAARGLLREALALWRGPAFADLPEVGPLTAAMAGFEQLRRELTDLLIQSSIDAGMAKEVVGLAADALDADPLREPAVLLLMRALAATGQAPPALRTGRAFRQRLAEETGLDPSTELAAVEREIAQGMIGPVHSGASPPATRRCPRARPPG